MWRVTADVFTLLVLGTVRTLTSKRTAVWYDMSKGLYLDAV